MRWILLLLFISCAKINCPPPKFINLSRYEYTKYDKEVLFRAQIMCSFNYHSEKYCTKEVVKLDLKTYRVTCADGREVEI